MAGFGLPEPAVWPRCRHRSGILNQKLTGRNTFHRNRGKYETCRSLTRIQAEGLPLLRTQLRIIKRYCFILMATTGCPRRPVAIGFVMPGEGWMEPGGRSVSARF